MELKSTENFFLIQMTSLTHIFVTHGLKNISKHLTRPLMKNGQKT